ncbi:MAG: hypothetical protein E6G67_03215 [Actinobacteria bacterium]|nr:MAG: hypothetical protein E6G67_03215 [Actinomycetota bacterium]
MKKLLALAALIVIAGALGFVLAACGSEGAVSAGQAPTVGSSGSGGGTSITATIGTTTPLATASTSSTQTGATAAPLRFQVWFPQGERLLPVLRTHVPTARVATAAVNALLAGPTQGEFSSGFATAIPIDTRLLGVSVSGGVATVDLTSEYESGGGELSMQMRLGQVVFTLTQFPTVKAVRFELDGQPVSVFSSEGIVLDHPVGRGDYDDLMPPIIVASPTPGATVGTPVTVSGTADVFEANVTVRILDAAGHELGHQFTTATCGTGCRGRFRISVDFDVPHEQHGMILVSDDDAAGTGTPPHVVRIPVVLEPRAD